MSDFVCYTCTFFLLRETAMLSDMVVTSYTQLAKFCLIKIKQNAKFSSQLYPPHFKCSTAIMWLMVTVLESTIVHITIIPDRSYPQKDMAPKF